MTDVDDGIKIIVAFIGAIMIIIALWIITSPDIISKIEGVISAVVLIVAGVIIFIVILRKRM